MRYAQIHCRNAECGQHIWVPERKLGLRGRCPECGHWVETPANVPPEELFEGPHIMQEFDESEQLATTVVG